MRAAIVVLSMFAVALCAPTGEKADILDVDSDDMRVKRAKEIMMFGNQQNEQQKDKAKRGDPEENVDEKGYIIANEPTDLVDEVSDNADVADVADETVSDTEEIKETENGDSTETEELESQETETTQQDNFESTDTEEMEQNTALEPINDNWENYLKELEEMQGDNSNLSPYFNSLLKGTRDPYWNQQDAYRYLNSYNSKYDNYQRKRRSQLRAMKNMRFPILKRAHRAKRQAYYVPDAQGYLPYDERLLDTQYNKYPMTEEDLAELLDLLDGSYDDTEYINPYEGYAPYDEMGDVEFESPIYMPKRQAGLTFVPGIKRNPEFYPYFTEPYAHFQAFVPDKRSLRDEADAYDAYARVMELAAALRDQNYYPEEYFEGYRRRK
ncbi:uncharacterized protein LOC123552104 [Mercenaria mercenaria]|uniref:uncharacterized protein LOC123552104 n=1 Tax=Mercenaria mercenaria TaxID=6596 RepID=UPI001E1D39EA|nr:uncharacterized protein LOC123552104 [Mercenaria mercenaria]